MDLTDRRNHFEFGQNWKDYATTIDQDRLLSAMAGLEKLFPDGLAGKTFLDIGCGSGVHSLAALSLGATRLLATDIDEISVGTTRNVLSPIPKDRWESSVMSVFDMTPEAVGQFDVVYSWGVLHHTGAMWPAIERAAALVKPGGQFALAIYSKTSLDFVWKFEKRIYSCAPTALQWVIRQMFLGALFSAHVLRGRNPASVILTPKSRGMNFTHDVHDWLGGFPYETATAEQLHDTVCSFGFSEARSFRLPPSIGLFGSGCQEFVFRRHEPPPTLDGSL
jgi:2-polyprenyl-6-hydroxyphenyl methylase/3-demethylubiquinone-9 3-methyltransferase